MTASSVPRSAAGTSPAHPAEEVYGPSRNGSVMLDIGGDNGALVLETPAAMAGREIEISPRHAPDRRSHVAVRERHGNGPVRYAAIYPSLPAGQYTLWDPSGPAAGTVTITAGEVLHTHWTTTDRPTGPPLGE